jgi:hypothetical protein
VQQKQRNMGGYDWEVEDADWNMEMRDIVDKKEDKLKKGISGENDKKPINRPTQSLPHTLQVTTLPKHTQSAITSISNSFNSEYELARSSSTKTESSEIIFRDCFLLFRALCRLSTFEVKRKRGIRREWVKR